MRAIPVAAVAALVTLSACGTGTASSSSLDTHGQDVLTQWLICIDCGGQLDSLRALATRAPEPTVDSLNVALLHGPSVVTLVAADSVFGIAYARDSAYRAQRGLPPLTMSRPAYVADERARYVDGYESRGATGLGWIHDARAVADLQAALAAPLVPGVVSAVRFALDSLPHP